MTALSLTGVTKAFGSRLVLTGVELEVPTGSLTAILGPSGSGKTTMLRIVAGFERARSGTVRLDDRVVDDATTFVPPEKRGIGYVPQEGNLFPHLNVAANIGFGLARAARSGRPAGRAAVSDLVDLVGMQGLERRFPHQLSGGQQQRVALARALAINPGLVLLDEPFSSLDAALRASVRADVVRILRQAGATAVLVTHDQDEALSLADTVAVIRDGAIAQRDAPEALYTGPVDPHLASFVGEVNLLAGVVETDCVRTALGPLAVKGGVAGIGAGAATVLVRPEQLELEAPAAGTGSGPSGVVVEREYYGHDAIVRVALQGVTPPVVLVARTSGAQSWRPGDSVRVRALGAVVAWASAPAQA